MAREEAELKRTRSFTFEHSGGEGGGSGVMDESGGAGDGDER